MTEFKHKGMVSYYPEYYCLVQYLGLGFLKLERPLKTLAGPSALNSLACSDVEQPLDVANNFGIQRVRKVLEHNGSRPPTHKA